MILSRGCLQGRNNDFKMVVSLPLSTGSSLLPVAITDVALQAGHSKGTELELAQVTLLYQVVELCGARYKI